MAAARSGKGLTPKRQQTAREAEEYSETASAVGERDFVQSRVFAAPRSLVVKAWTDPKLLARWWGPRKFITPVCEMDVRPGGAYRVVMRSPEGDDYPVKGVYREVSVPERLILTQDLSEHPAEFFRELNRLRNRPADEPLKEVLLKVTFEQSDGRTLLTVRTTFASTGDRDAFIKMGMAEGWGESLDRLEELLAKV